MLGEEFFQQRGVSGVTNDEFARGYGLAESRAQVVERDDVLVPGTQLAYHVAADITGAAGHKYLFVSHPLSEQKSV
jgi:hypothetical protein